MNDIGINLQSIADVLPELIQQALDEVGYIVENKAKGNCPVKSGNLRRSITHEIDVRDNTCTIGTNIDYSIAVHEGHGAFSGNPFLEDAFNNSIADVQARFEGLLERGDN